MTDKQKNNLKSQLITCDGKGKEAKEKALELLLLDASNQNFAYPLIKNNEI